MDKFLSGNGDVRKLRVYKLAVIISVITEDFVRRYIKSNSRTVDQMQQAARSCKQNIVEGSEAGKTSKESEIKLTNVARSSLGELLDDYMDYLRFHSLPIWGFDHPRMAKLREFLQSEEFENTYQDLLPKLKPETYCNLMITLIYQEMYLLDRLLKSQEKRFLEKGGLKEQMYKARMDYRNNQRNPSNRSDQSNQNNQNNQSDRNNQNNQSDQNNQNNQSNQNNRNDRIPQISPINPIPPISPITPE